MSIRWQILARDYSREGVVNFKIQPEYESIHKTVRVDSIAEEKEEIEIVEFIETKESD